MKKKTGRKPCLTERQKMAVEEFIKTGNKTKSALDAGYSKSYSYEVFNSKEVKKYLAKRRKEIAEKFKFNDEIVAMIYSIASGVTTYNDIYLEAIKLCDGDLTKAEQVFNDRVEAAKIFAEVMLK